VTKFLGKATQSISAAKKSNYYVLVVKSGQYTPIGVEQTEEGEGESPLP